MNQIKATVKVSPIEYRWECQDKKCLEKDLRCNGGAFKINPASYYGATRTNILKYVIDQATSHIIRFHRGKE